jgi:flagellar basal-body rod modification protein FlgD
MTSPISSSSVLPNDLLASVNPKATTADGNSVQDQQNQFLNLLSVQLQNQDPLNPMDNAQLTSQLAQLSTVQGINTMNATMNQLMTTFQSGQSLQAANMIGHGVLTQGTDLVLTKSQAIFGVSFGQDVSDAKVDIKDAKGNVVKTIDLGPQKAGTLPLGWNGQVADPNGGTTPITLADGDYSIAVSATVAGNPVTTASGLTFGQVASVSSSATSGVLLTLSGGNQINLNDIAQIL